MSCCNPTNHLIKCVITLFHFLGLLHSLLRFLPTKTQGPAFRPAQNAEPSFKRCFRYATALTASAKNARRSLLIVSACVVGMP